MKRFLTDEERAELKLRHRREKERRTADRIKAILLSDQGWTFRDIATALFLDEDTISKHVDEYISEKKLTFVTGGSEGKLSQSQTDELKKHLEEHTYLKSIEICNYVQETYGINYTVTGMTKWLKNNGFSYIKPCPVPAKADPVKQAAFIETYKKLKEEIPEDEPILFLDAVHPTMATKITYGWIKKGSCKTIETTVSKDRMNIVGALELATMELHKKDYDTVNSDSMLDFWDFLVTKYPGKKIHIILDNGAYNKCEKTTKAAEDRNIELHFLPPYSPNLNIIERVWKVMNEYTRNNRFFKTATEFREEINSFFDKTWQDIAPIIKSRFTDNFQTFTKPSFSG